MLDESKTAPDPKAALASWMIDNGIPTGHGDTMDDLLKSAGLEIQELRDKACQKGTTISVLINHASFSLGYFILLRLFCTYERAGDFLRSIPPGRHNQASA